MVYYSSPARLRFEETERARDLLGEAGYRVTLHDFQGGHSLPPEELARAVEWLVRVHQGR